MLRGQLIVGCLLMLEIGESLASPFEQRLLIRERQITFFRKWRGEFTLCLS